MSAICSLVSTYTILTTFWVTRSLRKWYLIGMCLVLECITRFLDILMAVVLSQLIVMVLSYLICKSSNVCFIQRTCVQQDATMMYSASVADSYADVCFLLLHATRNFPKKNSPSLVLFLSSILPSQSALVYAVRLNFLSFGYLNISSKVPLKYINIIFTYFK
jgi:hypothetical protein